MADLRRVVLDVLKPHDPQLLEFTERLAAVGHVEAITTSLLEHDREVQNVEITIEGDALDYGAIEEAIDGLGGTVHSIDEVTYGTHVVEERRTRRDG
ncbi:DUF211 domain-containing protein [Halorarum salinum]|uniref:DUF211 domain-containing protein n=1 Tax=Halorarum salinum TaxID=2743089 RepID=A0A7D5LA91_9EURY|nr:DUF211 domain-containing protein [Halobaculum salinum]QLG61852.1 DUF211 domain-containing protein [Halobaculum salinum]